MANYRIYGIPQRKQRVNTWSGSFQQLEDSFYPKYYAQKRTNIKPKAKKRKLTSQLNLNSLPY